MLHVALVLILVNVISRFVASLRLLCRSLARADAMHMMV